MKPKRKVRKVEEYSFYNEVNHENIFLLFEDESDNEEKKCENLNEGRICYLVVN